MPCTPKTGLPLHEPETTNKRTWLSRAADIALHCLEIAFYLMLLMAITMILLFD
jgi:hypothetical protein